MANVRDWFLKFVLRSGDPPIPDAGARAAHIRSMQFLLGNLTARQRDQFLKHDFFEVRGGDTGTTYRIKRGAQFNIEELDSRGRRLSILCFRPEGLLPVGDVMLAQKLALELYETHALEIGHAMHVPHSSLPFI
jgi:hypothetical protein